MKEKILVEVTVGKKILVADDEPAFVGLVDQVLTQKGYDVLKASSGQEGLRLLFADKPDLVLLDVVMAKMDGWQTCQHIRDVSDIPIIMLTAIDLKLNLQLSKEIGADGYITKPFNSRDLLDNIAHFLATA